MKSWQRVDIRRKAENEALEKKSKRTGIPVAQLRKPKFKTKKAKK